MDKPLTPFIIYRPNGDAIDWPRFDTTDGRTAVLVFTSRNKAEAFIRGKGMGPEWTTGQMQQPELLRWLRHNLMNGTPLVMVDPEPSHGIPVEIPTFLAEAGEYPDQGRDIVPGRG